MRMQDLQRLMAVLNKIVTHNLGAAWKSGSADEILRTANLLSDACKGLLWWEEQVAGAVFPAPFEDMQSSMQGWTSWLFDQMERIPEEVSKAIHAGLTGVQQITIVFSPPESMEAFVVEMNRRAEDIGAASERQRT
jgi:hypothetical protein